MLEIIKVTINTTGIPIWDDLKNFSFELGEMLNVLRPLIYSNALEKHYKIILDTYPQLTKELQHVSELTNISMEELLALNIFYDSHKLFCGCTAYIGNSEHGPLHLHCLDWDTAKETLTKHLKFIRFENQLDGSIVYSIGWPGYIGVFWGMRLNSFSISLNAVWSEVAANTTYPLGIYVRDILLKQKNYKNALRKLQKEEISSDCIFAISGIEKDDFAILERTPVSSALIENENYCCATNHYKKLKAGSNREGYIETGQEIFGLNSKTRLESAISYIDKKIPLNENDCFYLASKDPIENDLTILKAVYKTSESELIVRIPGNDKAYILKEELK